MRLSYEISNGVRIAAIEGQINGSNANELEEALLSWVGDGGESFVLDFSDVNYISSVGLRTVLLVAKKSRNPREP
jgi:stage II sporulation protein AA (anti-sigma F factor antagonist)